jgi:hypothetical protein
VRVIRSVKFDVVGFTTPKGGVLLQIVTSRAENRCVYRLRAEV